MRHDSRIVLSVMSGIAACVMSCGSSYPYDFGPIGNDYYVQVSTYVDNELIGSIALESPANLQVSVSVNGSSLVEGAGGYAELADRVEIQFHENGPWIDVTNLFKQYWWDENSFVDYHPVQLYRTTLTEPGEYVVLARVEYFDGVVVQTDPMQSPVITVTAAEEPAGDESSGEEGFDEEDEWVIREFTDPRDGTTYEIIDGRALVAFFLPVDMDAAWQFVAEENLDILSEWWMIGAISVLLPEETSVEEAVGEWPDEYPELIESVDPDRLVGMD